MQYYNIYVTYYNSSTPLSVGTPQQVVLKVTEVARNKIVKLIYLDSETTYSASLYPYNSAVGTKQLTLYDMSSVPSS